MAQLDTTSADVQPRPSASRVVRVMKDDDPQFDDADAAVTRAVTAFVSEIEAIFGKWEDAVSPSYIVESALVELSAEVSKLTEEFRDVEGPATSKLLDALATYRDSEFEDR